MFKPTLKLARAGQEARKPEKLRSDSAEKRAASGNYRASWKRSSDASAAGGLVSSDKRVTNLQELTTQRFGRSLHLAVRLHLQRNVVKYQRSVVFGLPPCHLHSRKRARMQCSAVRPSTGITPEIPREMEMKRETYITVTYLVFVMCFYEGGFCDHCFCLEKLLRLFDGGGGLYSRSHIAV